MDSKSNSSTKLDLYQLVTDQIISLLKQGVIPWQKPWNDSGPPMNLLSKRQYRGINLWLLLSLNYKKNLYLTGNQLKKLGGSVIPGQYPHIVVFWNQVKKEPEELDDKGDPKITSLLRYIKVYNIEQCKDIPVSLIPEIYKNEGEPILECEAIINTMPDCPIIDHKVQKAFYNIELDYINMPKKKSFKSPESYYSTLFHELVHSTGAEKRLGRKSILDMAPFGSESYAMEELIAEMGSAYLCRFTGIMINEIKNTVAYLDNWLEVFKKDKRFLITASGRAQKAVNWILGIKDFDAKEEVEESIEEPVVN